MGFVKCPQFLQCPHAYVDSACMIWLVSAISSVFAVYAWICWPLDGGKLYDYVSNVYNVCSVCMDM